MDYDLTIIGGGPAGYVAAIRAGQTGLKTAVVEKKHVGGMCLNWGCIPTKSLLESAKFYQKIKTSASKFGIEGIDKKAISFDWKKAVKRAKGNVRTLTNGVGFLLKKNGVEVIEGEAEILSETEISAANRTIQTKNMIIATGSYPESLPEEYPKDKIIEIEKLMEVESIPENIVITGNGPVAVEMAQFFAMIDKKVTWITFGDELIPHADKYIVDFIKKKFKREKIEIISDAVTGYEGDELVAGDNKIKVDMIINCRIRKAVLPSSKIDIKLDNGFIETKPTLQLADYNNIFAVGDVNGRAYLAHTASAQGIHAVNYINGVKKDMDISVNPFNMYSYPEVAQVGLTEEQVKEQDYDYKISEFPMSANGKALTEGETEGVVRLISENNYGEVLGVQIIAPHATDMIAEAATLMEIEGTIYDVAKTIHAHPTVSEIFMEAGFEAVDKAIHK